MFLSSVAGPLSPPSSPRMSGNDRKRTDSIWPHVQAQQSSYFGTGPVSTSSYGASYTSAPYQTSAQESLNSPPITASSTQSYPTSGVKPEYGSHASEVSPFPGGSHEASRPQARESPKVDREPSFDEGEPSEQGDDGDEEVDDDDGGDELKQEGDRPMTAAEIRNQKRKMKRFRLTHNQTRTMLNEFARQPHPDAAHRARLAREIPGLSPRQVQVWFQNRRAKLKRLTSEDRERMLRSRAIPDSFAMTSPMNQHYGASSSSAGPIAPGMGPMGDMQTPRDPRSLTLDTFRHVRADHAYGSPTGVSPTLGAVNFTPPHSATDVRSPVSAAGDMGTYGFGPRSIMNDPQRSVYAPSGMSTPSYPAQYQAPGRSSTFDRFRRQSGEPASSPLRTEMSYGGFGGGGVQAQDTRVDITQGQGQHAGQRDVRGMPPPSQPYGLGFSYDTMASFQTNMPPQSQAPVTEGQIQSGPTSYRNPGQVSAPGGSYPSYMDYGQSPYTSPHLQQYSSYNQPSYIPPLSSNPFAQQPSTTQPTMPPVLGHSSHYSQPGSSSGASDKAKEGGQGLDQGHSPQY